MTSTQDDLLVLVRQGDSGALNNLFNLVYSELRKLAGSLMRRERGHHTLQPTALVSEAYMRLLQQSNLNVNDEKHFIALTGRLMRQILVDYARARCAVKRGSGAERLTLSAAEGHNVDLDTSQMLGLDEALTKLANLNERQAKVVELKYFGGLSNEEVASALDCSTGTVKRDWVIAKAWLFRELSDDSLKL